MTLRAKLAFVLAALAASAVAAVGYLSYDTTRSRSLREIDQSLSAAVRFERGGNGAILDGLSDRDDRLPGRPTGNSLNARQAIDGNGKVVLSQGEVALPVDELDISIAKGRPSGVTRTVRLEDGTRYRVRTIGLPGGSGAIQVGRDLSETYRVLKDLSERLLLIGAAVVGVAAIAGWFIARQLTKGLIVLTRAAGVVSSTGRLDIDVATAGRDEVGRLGEAFSSMLGALRKSREDQRRLVQDAGHELRTPLTSVRTNVDVLRKHTDMPSEMRTKVLDDLDSEVAELSSLVEEVVAVASGAAAEEPFASVEIADIVEAAAERVRRRYGREIIVVADQAFALAQRSLLERAVTNLLDNAAKFDQGTEPIELSSSAGRIAVRDHGPGIAAVDLPRVFDRFYRSVESRSQPGSGLGLSIVTEVANSHGGSTFAENHPEGGAVVGLQLPVQPQSVNTQPTLTQSLPSREKAHT